MLGVALLVLARPGLADELEAGSPPEQAGGTRALPPDLTITLEAPLTSPLFSRTPVAAVEGEPITVGDLMSAIASGHAKRREESTRAARDYANVLERLITVKLIVQEARNIGLDELPEVQARMDAFSTQTLISRLVSEHLKEVEADPAQVDELYKRMSRELRLTTLSFQKEEDALSFHEQCKAGCEFDALARRFVEEGRAEGEIGGQEYVRLKDLLPRVAEEVFAMEVGALSQIFQESRGFLLFRLDDARFVDDPAAKEEARQKVRESVRRKKAREYGEFLEKKYATIDEELLREVSFEPQESGFLWFSEPEPVDFEKLLKDDRVLATVHDEEPWTVTVADLAGKLKGSFYHGIDKALDKDGELDQKKQITLKNMLFKKVAEIEALRQGIDKTQEYLDAVEKNAESLLFEEFISRVVAPDVKVTEQEAQEYYRENAGEFSTPRMLRMKGIAFSSVTDAEEALEKLRRGADFAWVSANSEGRVDADSEGLLEFDNALLSLTALPEDLHELVEKANEGDALLYSDPGKYHYVLAIGSVFAEQQKSYEAARRAIGQAIADQKIRALVADWGEKLREGYETSIFLRSL